MPQRAFCVFFICLVGGAIGLGQVQTTTGVLGTVTDPSGAVLPGVEITVTDQETGAVRHTVSNDQGYYAVQSLKPTEPGWNRRLTE